ncbi:MAG: hypothetical protein A3208_02340 [Candidatus Methanoprimaticola hominis]|nr:MAG: hypothetical protein A3208_02340 [Methanomassiliicoccales archaeon Mx-06]
MLYKRGAIITYLGDEFGSAAKWIVLFGICLLLVVFSFLLHEFGHKFTAQNFGMRSEFRIFPTGLFITLLTSVLGFLFAAPGAVYIEGNPTRKENGIISIAGPAVNILLTLVGIAGCLAFNGGGVVVIFFYLLAYLNAFLAVFNLLPIPPLDGSKIWGWSMPVYIVAIAMAALELAYLYLWMPGIYI